jgi:hypothetical protein
VATGTATAPSNSSSSSVVAPNRTPDIIAECVSKGGEAMIAKVFRSPIELRRTADLCAALARVFSATDFSRPAVRYFELYLLRSSESSLFCSVLGRCSSRL